MRGSALPVLLLAAVAAAHLSAQVKTPPSQTPGTPQTIEGGMEHEFAVGTWLDGMAEVEIANLADQRAENPDVKAFARQMIADHTKANDELKAIAAREQISLPTQLDGVHAALKRTLQGLKAHEFDRRYMDEMVKNHKLAVSSFTTEAKEGQNAALKAFAQKTLPTIEQHLRHAQDTARAVGALKK